MQFKRKIIASLLIGSGALAAAPPVLANDSEELEKLRALVQELDRKIRVLDRESELASEDAATVKNATPVVKAGEDGFGLKSGDGAFELKLRGQIQVDGRFYPSGDGYSGGNSTATAVRATDTFLLKQFRPTLQGTVFDKYDFLLTPDFGSGAMLVQDAYVDARFTPWFQVKAGKQKVPFGIERLQGEADGKFTERGLPNDLVPNRDIGAQVHGIVGNELVDYAVGYFNGVVDGGSSDKFLAADADNNRDKDIVARVFTQPFKSGPEFLQGLGFGLAATYGDQSGTNAAAVSVSTSNLNTYKSGLGQQTFFTYRTAAGSSTYADGLHFRWSPQFTYYNGPFGLLGEYVRVEQDVSRVSTNKYSARLNNDAWQIVGSWLLTGEDASYKNPKVKRPFDPDNGGWGAWELVARYGELVIDDKAFAANGGVPGRSFADPAVAARKAQAWAVGMNWYLNRSLKLALGYENTSFDGGWANAAGTVTDRPDEKAVSSRLQIAF